MESRFVCFFLTQSAFLTYYANWEKNSLKINEANLGEVFCGIYRDSLSISSRCREFLLNNKQKRIHEVFFSDSKNEYLMERSKKNTELCMQ